MRKLVRHAAVVLILVAVQPWQFAQSQQAQQADQPVLHGYQKAPQPISDILSARPTPLVRYVQLPYEAHGYLARESTEHTLWEMVTWFDKWVKNLPPGEQTKTASSGEQH